MFPRGRSYELQPALDGLAPGRQWLTCCPSRGSLTRGDSAVLAEYAGPLCRRHGFESRTPLQEKTVGSPEPHRADLRRG